MKINKKVTEGTWFKYDETTEFKIKPMRLSALNDFELNLKNLLAQFGHCLVDWKGVDDEAGATLECNDENKEFLFDYHDEVREFVFGKQEELKKQFNKEIKN